MAGILKVDQIQNSAGGSIALPGYVIQVQSANFTGTQTTTSQTYTDITDLSITMTPASTSSKFFVSCSIAASNSSHFTYMRFVRNGSVILQPDGAGSFSRATSHFSFQSYQQNNAGHQLFHVPAQCLDTPSTTSPVTYKVQMHIRNDGSGTAYINRTPRDLDNAGSYDARATSTLTVMEVAG